MQPADVRDAAGALQLVEERGLTHVKVGLFDADGVLRGKYISKAKFASALESGLGFCDVIVGWDVDDQTYDNVTYTGWHTGFPDAPVRILPETCRELAVEDGMLFFLCELTGAAEALCPRGTLRRVIEKAHSLGFSSLAALEYEFFVFSETPHSVRDKDYRNLTPLTPGSFGYSVLRNTAGYEIYHALLEMGERMDLAIEGIHTETGPGVLEAAITVDDALAAADKAALFKTFTKVVAQRHGLMATFMAKWSKDCAGQGGHAHLSLKALDGAPVFYDADAPHRISKTMRHFIAGQQALLPELVALIAPTVNSYTRLIPGFWAPTKAVWGIENRTCGLRAIPGSPKSQRVEYRVPGADANPYLVLAAALGSGLWGIENALEPDDPIVGNGYEAACAPERVLPSSLWDAAQRLKASSAARSLFGDAFVDHYAASREWEEREFRKHITDWELQRYFEII
jgi:glutamine synthetase